MIARSAGFAAANLARTAVAPTVRTSGTIGVLEGGHVRTGRRAKGKEEVLVV